MSANHYTLNVEKYIQRNITMTYLNQGAEISIPSTYNENIFILPVTYIVIKKKNLLSFNGQYWNLSSF